MAQVPAQALVRELVLARAPECWNRPNRGLKTPCWPFRQAAESDSAFVSGPSCRRNPPAPAGGEEQEQQTT